MGYFKKNYDFAYNFLGNIKICFNFYKNIIKESCNNFGKVFLQAFVDFFLTKFKKNKLNKMGPVY